MSTQERVAASFVSRYFEQLMTDAKQLSSLYVPKAHFNHEGKPSTLVTGPETIGRALSRLYRPNYGRVVIQDMKVTDTEAGRFAVSVGVMLYRRGSKEGEEFRHIVELQEHADSNGTAYGIYADTRQDLNKPGPSVWAMETPPMFAKTGNEAAIPELVQPPATTVAVEPVVAKEPTPKLQPVAAPEEVKPVEVAPVAEPEVKVAEVEAAPVAEAAPAQPAAKPSFADLVRASGPKTTAVAAPTRVEAKTEATKAKEKEEAEKAAKEEEAKKAAKKEDKDARRKTDRKKDDKDGEAGAKKGEDGEKKAGPSNRKEGGNKSMNNSVVFYDVIVKGLPQDATDKSVAAMVSSIAAVKKINLKSQPDKKDASITRTFAFVLFDHDSIVAAGSTVKDVIVKVQKEIRTKYGHQRIQVDEVREKFTQEEPREKAAATAEA